MHLRCANSLYSKTGYFRWNTSNPQPSKTTRGSSKWHRPRLYLTIVVLYLIGSSLTSLLLPILWFSSIPTSGGPGGAFASIVLVFYYMFALVFLALALISSLCLLRNNPYFKLPWGVMIAVTLVFGLATFVAFVPLFSVCTSDSLDSTCQTNILIALGAAGVLAITLLVDKMLLRGWRIYQHRSDPIQM